jgi:hypothetical protein
MRTTFDRELADLHGRLVALGRTVRAQLDHTLVAPAGRPGVGRDRMGAAVPPGTAGAGRQRPADGRGPAARQRAPGAHGRPVRQRGQGGPRARQPATTDRGHRHAERDGRPRQAGRHGLPGLPRRRRRRRRRAGCPPSTRRSTGSTTASSPRSRGPTNRQRLAGHPSWCSWPASWSASATRRSMSANRSASSSPVRSASCSRPRQPESPPTRGARSSRRRCPTVPGQAY